MAALRTCVLPVLVVGVATGVMLGFFFVFMLAPVVPVVAFVIFSILAFGRRTERRAG